MNKTLLSVCFTVMSVFTIEAQNQQGVVVIQNSGKKSLPQVAVVISDAQPTTSDMEGKFNVQLPNHVKGQRLIIQSISYKDWVVVNQHMVNQWVYAPEKVYRVDMCPKQEYTSRVEQLYQIGKNNSRTKYNLAITELKKLKEQGAVSSAEYLKRRQTLQNSLNKAQAMLDEYVPLLVAINIDYLAPIEKQAQQLVLEGKLDEAIQLYEGLQLETKLEHDLKLKKEWDDDIETLIPPIERFAQTLILQGGEESYIRAGQLLKMIADSSPEHMERNANYAIFAGQQNNYADAEVYYKKAIEHTKNPYDMADWYTKLANVYDELNRMEESSDLYYKAAELLEKLPRQIRATAELTVNLNINSSACVVKMCRNAKENDKRKGYRLALNSLEEATNLLEALKDTLTDKYQQQLMVCYNNMTSIYSMLNDVKGMERIQKKIDKLNLTDANNETLLEQKISKGKAAMRTKQPTKAIEHLLEANALAEKLYRDNPYQFKKQRILAYQFLGCAYYDANRYDDAGQTLTEGLALFETLPEENKEVNRDIFYDLYYNLFNSYFEGKHYYEIIEAFKEIHPYLGKQELEYDVPIWKSILYSAYQLGRYDILEYEPEILRTLMACADNKVFYSSVEFCYTVLGALHLNIGNIDACLNYYKLSDQCASSHGHKRMLAYGKLNVMSTLLMQHQPVSIIAQAPALEAELKKQNGDDDSFATLMYYRLLAHIMLKQWDEASHISNLMNQKRPLETPIDQCRALLSQTVLHLQTNQPAKPLLDRYIILAEEVRKLSLYQYWELMIDYYLIQLHYTIQGKDYKQAIGWVSKAMEAIDKLGDESPLRSLFISGYLMNKYGDLAYLTNNFKDALEAYENTFTSFYNYHAIQKKECYTYMYNWNAALLLDEDMLNYEKTVRQFGNARNGMLQQAFSMVIYLLHRDPEAGKDIVAYLKTRRMPEINEAYTPALLAYCKQMDGKLHKEYQPVLQQLIQLLQ